MDVGVVWDDTDDLDEAIAEHRAIGTVGVTMY
jgi:hypothetical protein